MSSKTSSSKCLVSKAIIKADIKNNWPFAVAALIVLILNTLVVLDSGYYIQNRDTAYYFRRFTNEFSFSYMFAVGYGVFMGAKLFAYLDKVNSVSCMHGFPFTRKKLYLSHIVSGFVLTAVPSAVITVLLAVIASFHKIYFTPVFALAFFVTFMIYAFIAFSVSCFAMMVCGNVVVSCLFSVFIAAIPAALIGFFEYICDMNLYGYISSEISFKILEFLYIFPTVILSWRYLVYLIGGILLLVCGYLVYKIRPLENCEEVVAFRKMRVFFIFAVGLCAGMISYLFFSSILNTESLLAMLPLGLAGIIGANMFARKTVSLKGSGIYLLIYLVIVSGLAFSFKNDIFGFETRVPKTDDVEYVEVDANGRNFYYYDGLYDVLPDYKLRTEQEIDIVRDLHTAYIGDEDIEYRSSSINWSRNEIYSSNYIKITYKLKNGSTVMRSYNRLSNENYEKYMLPLKDLEKMKWSRYGFIDDVPKEILEITVYDDRISTPAVSFTRADAEKLAEALKKDILTLSTVQMTTQESALSLAIEFYAPYTDINGKRPETFNEKLERSNHISVRINENFVNTIEMLGPLGYPVHDKAGFEKVEKITIRDVTPKADSEGYYDEYAVYDYEYSSIGVTVDVEKYPEKIYGEPKTVTDRNDMWEIYKMCGYGFEHGVTDADYPKLRHYLIQFYNYEGAICYDAEFSVIVENLPENIAGYFRAG